MTILALILLTGAAMSAAGEDLSIDRQGRRIQLDGFLLEWREADARQLWPNSPWRWDAINTPEGISGYFRATGLADTCRDWKFSFLPGSRASRGFPEIRTVPGQNAPFFAVAASEESPGSITVEWVVPWDSVEVDSAGRYRVGLVATGACGDTIGPIVLGGTSHGSATPVFARMVFQVVLIAALVIVYLIMRGRIKSASSRRKAGRSSGIYSSRKSSPSDE